jgi:TonB family protein
VLGDGRHAQPLTASHVGGAKGEQTTGQPGTGGGAAAASRCGSCGGPANGEDLCPACQQAFSAMLRKAAPAPATATAVPSAPVAPPEAAPVPVQTATRVPYNPFQPAAAPAPEPPAAAPASQPGASRVDQDLWAQLMGTPAPPPMDSFDLPPAQVPPPVAAPPPPPPPLPPPVAAGQAGPSEAAIRAAQIAAAQAAAIKLEPIKLEQPKPGPPPVNAGAATTPKLHTAPVVREAPAARTARPAAAGKPSAVSALLPATSARIAAAVALLCAIGLGAGATWYYFRDNTAPMTVIADVVEPEHSEEASAAAPRALPEPEPVQTPARRAPGDTAPQPPRTTPVPVNAPARAKAAPAGPFFQPSEVNEAPRVVRRIEPRVPSALRGRKLDEIVVVRALVSKDGQPSRVSLLRRSKVGVALDEAVVAAVNQWTFTPALKEGEPVSSWFNFAVPVSRPD